MVICFPVMTATVIKTTLKNTNLFSFYIFEYLNRRKTKEYYRSIVISR